MMGVLSIKNLKKTYSGKLPIEVLHGIDLEVVYCVENTADSVPTREAIFEIT